MNLERPTRPFTLLFSGLVGIIMVKFVMEAKEDPFQYTLANAFFVVVIMMITYIINELEK